MPWIRATQTTGSAFTRMSIIIIPGLVEIADTCGFRKVWIRPAWDEKHLCRASLHIWSLSVIPALLRDSSLWVTTMVFIYLGFRDSLGSMKLLSISIQAHLTSSCENKLKSWLYTLNLKKKIEKYCLQVSCPLLVLLLVEKRDSSVFRVIQNCFLLTKVF